jgi:hypothetical protein
MIRIAISIEAIARTLPFGNVSFENKTDEDGNRLICWTGRWSTGCARCAGRENRISDVILQIVELGG